MPDQNEFVQLYFDYLFKIMFGTQRNKKFTQDLLESYFNLEPGSLNGLKILNSVALDKETIMSRKYELDVKVKLPDGKLIDIEMQRKYDKSAEIRIFLYLSGLVYTQLKTGEEPKELKSTKSIIFTEELLIHKNKEPYQEFCMTNTKDKNDKMLANLFKTEIINVEGNCEYFKNKRFQNWLKFIRAKSHKELEEISKFDEIFEKALKERDRVVNTEYVQDLIFQERVLKLEKIMREKKMIEKALLKGKEKGKIEGKKVGIIEGKKVGIIEGEKSGKKVKAYEIAKKMLKSGESENKIIEYTSLTKEEIKQLKEMI